MFLIIGVAPVKKSGERIIRRECPRCNDIRNFQEFNLRQYLSFFFIPLFPLGRKNTYFACPTCSYAISSDLAYEDPSPGTTETKGLGTEQVIVICPRCDGPMKAPLDKNRQQLCCPHCSMEFVLKGIKEPVPMAVTLKGQL